MDPKVPISPPAVLSAAEPAHLQQWLVDAGDEVYAGERVAEIIVPGMLVSVAAPCSGRIAEIVVIASAEIRPGDVLAWVIPEDEFDSER